MMDKAPCLRKFAQTGKLPLKFGNIQKFAEKCKNPWQDSNLQCNGFLLTGKRLRPLIQTTLFHTITLHLILIVLIEYRESGEDVSENTV